MTPQAKPLMFVMAGERQLSDAFYARLAMSFGSITFKGHPCPFDCTGYYASEFGEGLFRHVICFKGLMNPAALPEYKHVAQKLERLFSKGGKRTYNLDTGYLDTDKLVLGSFKTASTKLYLGHGVFADILLQYAKGTFSPTPWAFADFKDGRYDRDLLTVREKLKADIKHCRAP